MENINYKLLGEVLYKKHPEVALELIEGSRPIIDDFTLIPCVGKVLDNMLEFPPTSTRETNDYHRMIIIVVLRLFDPDAFSGTRVNMRNGLRQHLSQVLDCSPTRISGLLREARDYLGIYKPFKREAIILFDEINFQYSGFLEPMGSVRFIN